MRGRKWVDDVRQPSRWSIVGDMMKRGINVFDQNDMPKVVKEINTTYSNFKTTYKHHEL
jgi:hypothetical protein